jgi:hypothetical protein
MRSYDERRRWERLQPRKEKAWGFWGWVFFIAGMALFAYLLFGTPARW